MIRLQRVLRLLVKPCILRTQIHSVRLKRTMPPLSQLVTPVPVQQTVSDVDVGAELVGKIDKDALIKHLAKFYQRPEVKTAALEYGLDSNKSY